MDQKILWKLSYGVYAVCSLDGSRPTGCIANSAMQITSAPPSIATVSYTHLFPSWAGALSYSMQGSKAASFCCSWPI